MYTSRAPCVRAQRLKISPQGSVLLVVLAALLWILGPSSGVAQIFPEGPLAVQYQFNFSSPGARSLGLGGAFLARANDSTTAYSNPAGLPSLREPEVAIEGRRWSYETVLRDVVDGEVVEITESDETEGASFFSVSYPFERWTLALYRHELANFAVSSGPNALFDSSRLDLEITGIGISAGLQVVDQMSIGVTIVQYELDLMAVQSSGGESVSVGGDENELGFNLGLLWDIGDAWRLAWVVRDGPEFDVTVDRSASENGRRTFTVPQVVGIGAAWKVTHRLTASMDFNYVRYSQTVTPESVEGGSFGVSDANELRLGLEYTLWQYPSSPAFRLGVWNDPAHGIRFKPREETDLTDDLTRVFPSGDDELHFAVGFGMVLDHFQFDIGADFSDVINTYSLSVAVFF